MSHLTKIFSGKLNDNCYLFTLKVIDSSTAQSIDIGTVIINSKTGNTLSILDELSRKCIDNKFIASAIKDCEKTVKEIQRVL